MMMQKVVSNAYSWWWASHIRTKQSKWLDQNLQDMEEKVSGMLEILDDNGDSFVQRANTYYRKRPELLRIVEETYRAYRDLAERYDLISKDLQTANRTIASLFPDQVPHPVHDEDDENEFLASNSFSTYTSGPLKPGSRLSVPKKDFQCQSMLSVRKGQLKKAMGSVNAVLCPHSGLSEEEASEEINKLQKEILEMQTEWELVKSSYEQGHKRLCEIEIGVTEKQKRVCSLQDEYDIGPAMDDNEARLLMANRILKSCQQSLDKLQQTHKQSIEEGRVESKRIKEVHDSFEAIRRKFNCPPTEHKEQKRAGLGIDVTKLVNEFESGEKGKPCMESLRKGIEEKLKLSSGSCLTMSQLAENIDDLVQRVVNLENAVFSENASVKRLKSDADELQEQVKSLEEDGEALVGGSDSNEQRICSLEGELSRVKDLLRTIIDQNDILKAHFTEASCNINHLSVNLQSVDMDEEVNNMELSEQREPEVDAKPGDSLALKDTEDEMEGKDEEDDSTEGRNDVDSESGNKIDADSEKGMEQMDVCRVDKKCFSETASSTIDTENPEVETDEEEELQNWRRMFTSGSDEREKILLDEYTSVLWNYKDVRKKLKEVDQKNRDGFYELESEIRELKNAISTRDEEIQMLRRKAGFIDENKDENLTEYEASHDTMTSLESTLSDFLPISPEAADEGTGESIEKEAKETGGKRSLNRSRSFLTPDWKIRSEIDELLEDNVAFWLRFCTSFHQIQKYQTSVQDLKSELSALREKKKQEANGKEEPLGSEGRPIYSHLREIKTELMLWMESNEVLKDEMQGRHSSLCNIEEDVSRMSNANEHEGEAQLNGYQAAKFQGEIQNMKQENIQVWNELTGGFDSLQQLKEDIENIMANLEREIETASASKLQRSGRSGHKVPLRSFLFGMKLKNKWQPKGSMFMCGQPQFQRQRSYIERTDY